MKCPFCNAELTKVIDSRPSDDNNSIRRRRQCENCGRRFTTYEKLETFPLMVIKKDNTREPYDRSKIEAGIDEVENTIFNMDAKEVQSKVIGELVMNKLRDLEAVAYVRFASVYREFKDVDTFADELKKLMKKED